MLRLRHRSAAPFALVVVALLGGCAVRGPRPASVEASRAPERFLIAPTPAPVLFLGSERDAPMFGFASPSVEVEVLGAAQHGRVPVRIGGSLEVTGFVPQALLTLAVQRRGRIRGTPVYVGPNDRVRPLGPDSDPNRTRVAVSPVIAGVALGPFEGTFPSVGLGVAKAPDDAEPPASGTQYELAPGRALALYDESRTSVAVLIPAQRAPVPVTVVASDGGWAAVRIGEGPYLIGYTNEPLTPVGGEPHPARTPRAPTASSTQDVPARLAHEAGLLKRVAAGTRVTFNERVIAVFERPGWARVLARYPAGTVDVFAAADDGVAVRGLVPEGALSEPPSLAGRAQPSR